MTCSYKKIKLGIQARPLGRGPLRAPVLGDGLVCIYLITAVIRYITPGYKVYNRGYKVYNHI